MINEIEKMIDQYVGWLREEITLREMDEWVEITTPYMDRNNDYLQIYAKKENGGYLLTDDGYTISELEQSGCNLKGTNREQLLNITLNGFGVKRSNNELLVSATPDNFAFRKHNLIQAILAVNDMFYLAMPTIKSLFFEDVESWFNKHQIRFSSRVSFIGKTGFIHNFDFIISKSLKCPERIIKAINTPNKGTIESMIFAWMDTRETRPENAKAYALLNDAERSISDDIVSALRNYQVNAILWSKIGDAFEDLAA